MKREFDNIIQCVGFAGGRCETNPFQDDLLIVAPFHKQDNLPAGVAVDRVHLKNKQSEFDVAVGIISWQRACTVGALQ